MKKLDVRNIDKTNWIKYRFEEIAESISERVEPHETNLDTYVGLEHLDAESLHIKRTGVPSDVKGTKLKVYKGDIIFGKRRAYQRKASIAHFDGICSAHAMVFRAKSKVIDLKLFPFFLHSDYFMHRAIDISVGGLSPTINWGTLRHQEFLIPSKDQQKQLADLFWAGDLTILEDEKLLFALKQLLQRIINDFYEENMNSKITINSINTYKGQSILPYDYPTEEFLHYSLPTFEETGKPIKQVGKEIQSNKLLIAQDCVLFSKLNPRLPKIWHVKQLVSIRQVASTEWLPIALNSEFDNNYLRIILAATSFLKKIERMAQGTSSSHKRIEPDKFYNLQIPLPDEQIRIKFVVRIQHIEQLITLIEDKVELSRSILKQIINQIFSE